MSKNRANPVNTQAYERLVRSLTTAIEIWWHSNPPSAGDLGYIGENAYEIMARAALLPMRYGLDVEEYLRNDNQLK